MEFSARKYSTAVSEVGVTFATVGEVRVEPFQPLGDRPYRLEDVRAVAADGDLLVEEEVVLDQLLERARFGPRLFRLRAGSSCSRSEPQSGQAVTRSVSESVAVAISPPDPKDCSPWPGGATGSRRLRTTTTGARRSPSNAATSAAPRTPSKRRPSTGTASPSRSCPVAAAGSRFSPRLTEREYADFYRDVYRPLVSAYHGRLIDAETVQVEQREYADELVAFLRENLSGSPETILDVGGSTGVVSGAIADAFGSRATVSTRRPTSSRGSRARARDGRRLRGGLRPRGGRGTSSSSARRSTTSSTSRPRSPRSPGWCPRTATPSSTSWTT